MVIRYISDLQSGDMFMVHDDAIVIESFVPIDAGSVVVLGYYDSNGDGFRELYDLDETVRVVR